MGLHRLITSSSKEDFRLPDLVLSNATRSTRLVLASLAPGLGLVYPQIATPAGVISSDRRLTTRDY